MNVLVSGSAARAVFVEGHDVTYIDAEWPETLRKGTTADIALLLANAPDVEELRNVDKNEALARLLELWNRDRALRMLQLVMQPGPDADLSSLAFEYLDGLLQSETVEEYVLDYACAVDLPSAQNLGSDKLFSEAWKNAHRIVSTVIELQDSIREVRRGGRAYAIDILGLLKRQMRSKKPPSRVGCSSKLCLLMQGG